MSARDLPPELQHALRAARTVETAATTRRQARAAVDATARLLLAAVHAGWRPIDLAAPLQVTAGAVATRIRRARRASLTAADLDVEPYRPARAAIAREIVAHRGSDWLRLTEATTYARVSTATLVAWRSAGMLPNARRVHRSKLLYLRADLDRILAAPAYNGRGHNHQMILEEIAANGGT